jgi:predicted permease
MTLIDKIRQKPQQEKVRLIWIICGVIGVIMIGIWIFTSNIGKPMPKDTSLFKTIKNSVKNLR